MTHIHSNTMVKAFLQVHIQRHQAALDVDMAEDDFLLAVAIAAGIFGPVPLVVSLALLTVALGAVAARLRDRAPDAAVAGERRVARLTAMSAETDPAVVAAEAELARLQAEAEAAEAALKAAEAKARLAAAQAAAAQGAAGEADAEAADEA